MQATAEREAPFQLRGNSFTLMVLRLVNPDDPDFFGLLVHKIRQAPNFFRNAPVVLDLDGLAVGVVDFEGLIEGLRNVGLVPVGIQGGTGLQQDAALRAGLTALPAARAAGPAPAVADAKAPARPEAPRVEPARRPSSGRRPSAEPQRTTLMVTEPVRSGQQVYAAGGDLVVLAPVSAGAELLADGNIHVYGALRGRAVAGIGGDTGARIFCQSLEAELVSVAGIYRVSEDLEPALRKRQVQIYLDTGYLRIDPLS